MQELGRYPGKHLARRRRRPSQSHRNGVVGAASARDRVEQDQRHRVVFDRRLAFISTISGAELWTLRGITKVELMTRLSQCVHVGDVFPGRWRSMSTIQPRLGWFVVTELARPAASSFSSARGRPATNQPACPLPTGNADPARGPG